jgi:hypothetical protein
MITIPAALGADDGGSSAVGTIRVKPYIYNVYVHHYPSGPLG